MFTLDIALYKIFILFLLHITGTFHGQNFSYRDGVVLKDEKAQQRSCYQLLTTYSAVHSDRRAAYQPFTHELF